MTPVPAEAAKNIRNVMENRNCQGSRGIDWEKELEEGSETKIEDGAPGQAGGGHFFFGGGKQLEQWIP